MTAYTLAMLWAGAFLGAGMLTGIWKYARIMASPEAEAPYYVSIAHRTALLYSFACVVLALLALGSAWPEWLDLLGVWLAVVFFAAAVASYVLHGILRDTDNQLARPHKLGDRHLPGAAMKAFMLALIVCEIGGLAILLSGFVAGID